MINDGFWQVFMETGDPMCWLMYTAEKRQVTGQRTGAKDISPEGDQITEVTTME